MAVHNFQFCLGNRVHNINSAQSLDLLSRQGDMRDDSAEILFQSFLREALLMQFWNGQGCPLFYVVHPAFPLSTTASPNLQDVLKDGFEEAVMACDMPEPFKFPSLGSCQKRFLWTHKGVDLASHPVIVFVF